jgi:hypothetical protein
MNGAVLRGLVLDAYHQVVDNRVFRILLAMVAVAVATTFLVAVRDDGLRVLWIHFPWSDVPLFRGFTPTNAAQIFIDGLQELFVDRVAGFVGPLFSIAAAAFFVPRMLERGFADTLFSKPVSRTTLLLSRYAAGLLFITTIAALLVVGMHVGFLVRSGYSSAGFLWSAPMLVYRFAVLFAFTVMVGVLARSSTAALLATLLFMTVNGAVHQVYELKVAIGEYETRQRIEREERDRAREAAGRAPRRAATASDPIEPSVAGRIFSRSIDVLHIALPKPGDSNEIVRLLRGLPPDPPKSQQPPPVPLTWTGPPGRSALVSIGTSLAFVVVCLAAAAWRLSRIRF